MSIPYFDLHCDTISGCEVFGHELSRNGLHIDISRATANYEPYAQVFAIFGRPAHPDGMMAAFDSSKPDASPESLYGEYERMMGRLKLEFSKNADKLRHCLNGADIEDTIRDGRIAALVSVEGAELLMCSPERLREAYAAGVRIVNISWNFDNVLTGASQGVTKGGLTERGREFIAAAEDLGVVLDVSHISDAGFWDMTEVCKRPFIASHSNLRSLCNHPRNLTDDMFKALVSCGGIAGLNLCPQFLTEPEKAADISSTVAHIDRFCSLGGAGNICIGGDLDGVETLPEGIGGVEDIGKIYEALLRANYSEELCRDIFYNNAYRYFERVL